MGQGAVLVTGAGRRIGAAIVRALHGAGMDVVLHCHRSHAEADFLAATLNAARAGSATVVRADLLDVEALPGLVERAAAPFGRLDALVNNASSFHPSPIGAIGSREWDDLMGTNLRAPLLLAQAAAPRLRQARGAIVNIVDIHAERPLAGYSLYSVAKAGLAGLTRSLALELAPEVRVNGVAPGAILWPENGDRRDPVARERRALSRRGTRAHRTPDASRADGPAGGSGGRGKIPPPRRPVRDRPDPGRGRGTVPPFMTLDTRKEDFESAKLAKRLRRLVGQAIADFSMIEAGDKVMVCLSGGKDSYAMLDVLMRLREKAPVAFELVAVNLDQRHPGFPEHVLPDYLRSVGVPFHIEVQDTYSVVKRVIPEGKTMCGLCSRLRRGVLYRLAGELGCTKIALGHHRDDIMETFFLNLFHGGKLKAMPAKLRSDDGKHVVIRPLAYVEERDLEAYAELRQFPIIPCDLCGSQDQLQRKQVKALLREWEKKHPGRVDTIFNALGNVAPSHLMDRTLFDFDTLAADDDAAPETFPIRLHK
jgi:tRNA 2-thiocytidine biosynthesis protein TtcA